MSIVTTPAWRNRARRLLLIAFTTLSIRALADVPAGSTSQANSWQTLRTQKQDQVWKCDRQLLEAYRTRQNIYATAVNQPDMDLTTSIYSDIHETTQMRSCGQFGPLYRLEPLARGYRWVAGHPKRDDGRPSGGAAGYSDFPKRSELQKPLRMTPAQCADLDGRLTELEAKAKSYETGPGSDAPNASAQARGLRLHLEEMSALNTYCAPPPAPAIAFAPPPAPRHAKASPKTPHAGTREYEASPTGNDNTVDAATATPATGQSRRAQKSAAAWSCDKILVEAWDNRQKIHVEAGKEGSLDLGVDIGIDIHEAAKISSCTDLGPLYRFTALAKGYHWNNGVGACHDHVFGCYVDFNAPDNPGFPRRSDLKEPVRLAMDQCIDLKDRLDEIAARIVYYQNGPGAENPNSLLAANEASDHLEAVSGIIRYCADQRAFAAIIEQVLKRKNQKRERQERKDTAARGDSPRMSARDGSCYAVDTYLKENLNDANYEHVATAIPVVSGPYWLVRSKFRARNGFGAKTITVWRFYIQGASSSNPDGEVVRAEEERD